MPALPVQTAPWPPQPTASANQCGDLNLDRIVNQVDLDLFDARITSCGYSYGGHFYSGQFDVDHDLEITPADRAIIAANAIPPRCLADVNGDGCIDTDDVIAVSQVLDGGPIQPPNPNWNPIYDVNCDGLIDDVDQHYVQTAVTQQLQCPGCNP
jgi:hypothetical protein